ncbi:MAG: SulP family inorganic anion transporter [Actinomycetota bacterium]
MSNDPTTGGGTTRPSRATIQGDLLGGLVAAIVALPLALAFGVQSGLGAEAGVYGAIGAGIVAALFGGTPSQVTGPTGPMTVVSATVVSLAIAREGDVDSALGLILLTFLVGGVAQIVFGLIGVARYVRYFPYPVISGFMSGVGLIIVVLQIWPFLGSDSPKSTLDVIRRIDEPLSNINAEAVGVGALTVAVFYLLPRLTKAIPAALAALIVGTVASRVLGLDVPTIGDIPSGLPALRIGEMFDVDPGNIGLIIEYGLILAVLGSIDSLLTSVIADNITRTKHDPNRELVGQGLGNIAAALIGGLPGAGATKGTVVNIDAGGRTRLSGAFHGVLLLVMLLGAGSLVSDVPLAVLAGILIPIGFAIVDTRGIRHLRAVGKADGAVLVLVLLITVFGDLIVAVGTGIALACVLFMLRIADLSEERTRLVPLDNDGNELPVDDEMEQVDTGIYAKHVYGPLFFGFATGFRELTDRLPANARVLVIDLDRVPTIDQSGLYALEDVVLTLEARGVEVFLARVADQPLDRLRAVELVGGLVSEDHVFDEFDAAVAAARTLLDTSADLAH